MIRLLASTVLLLCVGIAMCQKEADTPAPDPKPYYVKVEAKGDLLAYNSAEFDPKAPIKRGEHTGVKFFPGGLYAYELLAQEKDQFDLMTKNSGKKVVVTGELERHHVYIPPFGSSGHERGEVREIIRVSTIRLAE